MEFNLGHLGHFKDVFLACASNVSNGFFHQFDTRSTIVGNDVPSDVWLTVLSITDHAIKRALLNPVPPNKRHTPSLVIIAHNLHSILMSLRNLVIKNLGLIILNLNSDSTNLHFVLDNIGVDVNGSDDG